MFDLGECISVRLLLKSEAVLRTRSLCAACCEKPMLRDRKSMILQDLS